MARRKRSFTPYYILAYVVIFAMALIALSINIKTVPLNEKIQRYNTQLSRLKDDNQVLVLRYLEATRLEEIERVATADLKMVLPRSVRYFDGDTGLLSL